MHRPPLPPLLHLLIIVLFGLFGLLSLAPAPASAAPDAEVVVDLDQTDPAPDLAPGPVTDWVFLVVNDINDNLGASDSDLPSVWQRWAAKLALSLDRDLLLIDDIEVRIDKLEGIEGAMAAEEVALFLGLPADVLRAAADQLWQLVLAGDVDPAMGSMAVLLDKAAEAIDQECAP